MRPSFTLLALPPLPPRGQLKTRFPPVAFAVVNRLRNTRAKPTDAKRLQPVDARLTEELVKSFGIRKGSHVLEGFPGMGTITRELLRLPPDHIRSILSIEPSRSFLINGLDFPPEARTFDPSITFGAGAAMLGNPLISASHSMEAGDFDGSAADQARIKESEESPTHYWYVLQSKHDERLKIADNSIYRWDAVEDLINGGYLDHVTTSKWEDESPDLHLVAQIPGVGLGEQLVAQWISCIPQRSWLFRYGRVKLSLIVSPNLYDRLVAQPGDKTYCKLSAMRNAVADYVPSHPDYVASAIRSQHIKPAKPGSSPPSTSPSQDRSSILLSHDAELWYPNHKPRNTAERASGHSTRPGMMGITLVPKRESPVDGNNHDAWEYVMRKMFVVQNQAVAAAIKNLGPGAANLLPHLIGEELPAEQRFDAKKRVRDFNSHEWGCIVEVFMGWKFAPETLALTEDFHDRVDHKSRNMGMSL